MRADSLPAVDRESCTSCGLCVEICPDRILLRGADGGINVMAEQCMGCGHCYAICPVEAISMPGLSFDLGLTAISTASGVEDPNRVTIRPLLNLMRSRRSCRSFKPGPPKLSVLKDLARIGTTAPSGTNSQGWQFVVLPERSDVIALGEVTADFYRRLNRKASRPLYRFAARLFVGDTLERYYRRYYKAIEQGLSDWYENGIDRLFHGAPSAIVVAADQSSSCPQEDALLATQNILLAAESMGMATCLIGFVVEAAKRDKQIAAALRLSSTETIYSVIGCGYSTRSFKRFAGRQTITPRVVRLSGDRMKRSSEQGQGK